MGVGDKRGCEEDHHGAGAPHTDGRVLVVLVGVARESGLAAPGANFCWASATRGSFSYANPSILAYILYELTGETPLEFATSTGALPPSASRPAT